MTKTVKVMSCLAIPMLMAACGSPSWESLESPSTELPADIRLHHPTKFQEAGGVGPGEVVIKDAPNGVTHFVFMWTCKGSGSWSISQPSGPSASSTCSEDGSSPGVAATVEAGKKTSSSWEVAADADAVWRVDVLAY